ncbi:MAG: hypothetical protein DMG24_01115 [Acidobacteria bacterium]|nr:MAG: hypothetical protein DMG24_01115 [Acidobacteriota bacterium]
MISGARPAEARRSVAHEHTPGPLMVLALHLLIGYAEFLNGPTLSEVRRYKDGIGARQSPLLAR